MSYADDLVWQRICEDILTCPKGYGIYVYSYYNVYGEYNISWHKEKLKRK